MALPPCPPIEALTDDARSHLMSRAVPRRLGAGEYLFVAGDRAPRIHVVDTGLLKLIGGSAAGDETIVHLAVPGELVGETAALDDMPQSLDAVAAAPSRVLGFDAEVLIDVIAGEPAAARELMVALARRVRWMSETALERSVSEVPARLAGRILDLADLLGHISGGAVEVDLPLAQHDIAKLAGMCRESASKTMARFRERGWIDYERKRLRILRPDMLERLRCAGRVSRPSR